MTQCNTVNLKLYNSELDKLKSGIKNGIKNPLNFSLNAVGNSNDKTNFLSKLLSTSTQVLRLLKTFPNV